MSKNIVSNFRDYCTILLHFLNYCLFPACLPLALSVVSMEVFAPHKMAEMVHSNERLPGPRILLGMVAPDGDLGIYVKVVISLTPSIFCRKWMLV